MTQPRIDWDRDVSLPVSGRTPQSRHASATGAQAAADHRVWLKLAYRDLLITRGPQSDHEAQAYFGPDVGLSSINSTRHGWNRGLGYTERRVYESGDFQVVVRSNGRITKRVRWAWRENA